MLQKKKRSTYVYLILNELVENLAILLLFCRR